jgi:uncharacterized protein
VAVLNDPALLLLQRFREPQALGGLNDSEVAAAQQLYRAGLLHPCNTPPMLPSVADTLVAWLHVTNACTLNCSYCYVPKGSEAMSRETAFASVNMLVRLAVQYGYGHIHLKYSGGEPSLNLPLVEQTHRYAQQQAERAGIGVQGGVLSNGVGLSEDKLQRIRELGLRLMISLDGPQQQHDAQRPTMQGGGSFAAVVTSIEWARHLGLELTVSVTVTGASAGGLPEVVGWLMERGVPFSLNFYREHNQNSDSASRAGLRLDEEQLIAGMRAAYRTIEQHTPRYSLLAGLLDRTNLSIPHRYTCPAGAHYLVIDQRGRIAQCHMTIGQPVTTVWDDDPLGTLRRYEHGLRNLPVEAKEGCSDCEWRYWCAGGCPLMTHHATGRYDTRSPNCIIYRALFPDLIRLEGLRLLHQATHA